MEDNQDAGHDQHQTTAAESQPSVVEESCRMRPGSHPQTRAGRRLRLHSAASVPEFH